MVKEEAGVEKDLSIPVDAVVDLVNSANNRAAIVTTDKVFPLQNFGSSCLKTVDWSIGGKRITPQSDYYHLRSYFDTELYGTKDTEGHLLL